MPTNRLLVKGIVQGVFYRATAKKVADSLSLTGWIKNTAESDVEIMATGSKDQLDEFIAWCREGPEKAEVTDLDITLEKDQLFDSFEIIRRK